MYCIVLWILLIDTQFAGDLTTFSSKRHNIALLQMGYLSWLEKSISVPFHSNIPISNFVTSTFGREHLRPYEAFRDQYPWAKNAGRNQCENCRVFSESTWSVFYLSVKQHLWPKKKKKEKKSTVSLKCIHVSIELSYILMGHICRCESGNKMNGKCNIIRLGRVLHLCKNNNESQIHG